jgi:hypothetical protein
MLLNGSPKGINRAMGRRSPANKKWRRKNNATVTKHKPASWISGGRDGFRHEDQAKRRD